MRITRTDWLLTFVTVVDAGGFAPAARRLQCAQSRVSDHVSALERALGHTLLDRRRRPAELTGAGAVFLPHARQIVASVSQAEAEVDDLTGVVRGHLVVGTIPSVSASFLPGVLSDMVERHPLITVDITERTTTALLDALEAGTIDVAIRSASSRDDAAALSSYPLWCEPYVAVAPEGHRLAGGQTPLEPGELAGHRLLATGAPGVEIDPELAQLMRRWGLPTPGVRVHSEQPQTVLNLVRAGLGIGVVNLLAFLASDHTGLRARQITSDEKARRVELWWDPRGHASNVVRAFAAAVLAAPVPQGTEDVRRPPAPLITRPIVPRDATREKTAAGRATAP